MIEISTDQFREVARWGRPANATVAGERRSGYFLKNKFYCPLEDSEHPVECIPTEFKQLRIWRK